MGRRLRASPWVWAALALSLVFAWQALTVRANYGGNWTGLFRTGHAAAVPPRLAPGTFRNANPVGYDGQYYRMLAHDPFLRRDTASYLDAPLLRSRRILVPLAAWALVGGSDSWIDGAYVLVVAACVFLGVYALAKTMQLYGRHAAWGLLFLIVPAAPIAVDSMTVDVAIAALTACFAYRLASGSDRGLWWILASACLVRETGVLLAVACVLVALAKRDVRKASLWASAVLPTLVWYGYLYQVLPPAALAEGIVPKWFYPHANAGILVRAIDPPRHLQLAASLQGPTRALDFVALLATILTIAAGIALVRKMRPAAMGAAFLLYLGLVLAATDKDFWNTPYGYTRPIVPVFVLPLVAAGSIREQWVLPAVAVLPALVELRILGEMQTQAMGVLRLLTHS
jgi:hypothetical protein